MGTTITPNLGLIKPNPFEEEDTWGPLLNSNCNTLDQLFSSEAALLVSKGGTGAITAAAARTNLGLGSSDSPQFNTIELGNASDTTLSRTAAGVIAVEGKKVVTEDANGNAAITGVAVMASSFLRNRIINGGFDIWQRGTSIASANGYIADRWLIGATGANPSITRVAGPTGFQYACRVTAAVGNTLTVIAQRVESANIADLAGRQVTFTAVISPSASQTFSWRVSYANTEDNFASDTQIATGTWSVTTGANTCSATITLPASAANGVQVNIYPANGGAYTSGSFDITGIQLEAGTVATPFERRLYGQELVLCQRYFQFASYGFSGTVTSGQAYYANINLPVVMRAYPTASYVSSWSAGAFGVGTPTFSVVLPYWIVASKIASASSSAGVFFEYASFNAEL